MSVCLIKAFLPSIGELRVGAYFSLAAGGWWLWANCLLYTDQDDMQVDDKLIQPGPALLFQHKILQSQAALLTQPIAGPAI
jgi:hypothetical protein